MSQVVSIRLKDDQLARLRRFARRAGKSQGEMAAQLVEEAMRESEFAWIEFRTTAMGRVAAMKGSGLAVWEVVRVARDLSGDSEGLCAYLNRPAAWVQAALGYADAYPEEIDLLISDAEAGEAGIGRLLPQLETITVPAG